MDIANIASAMICAGLLVMVFLALVSAGPKDSLETQARALREQEKEREAKKRRREQEKMWRKQYGENQR